jgi:hypothetical protein
LQEKDREFFCVLRRRWKTPLGDCRAAFLAIYMNMYQTVEIRKQIRQTKTPTGEGFDPPEKRIG